MRHDSSPLAACAIALLFCANAQAQDGGRLPRDEGPGAAEDRRRPGRCGVGAGGADADRRVGVVQPEPRRQDAGRTIAPTCASPTTIATSTSRSTASTTSPTRSAPTSAKRDSAFNDDWFALSLDSAGTGQTAYHLFTNPSGSQMDALNTSASGEQFDADMVWYSAAKTTSDGYVVEVQIPLQTLRFSGGDEVRMGLVFFRKVSRIGVSYAWPEMLPGQWVFDRPAHLLFSNLKPRRLVELLPSVTYNISQERDIGRRAGTAPTTSATSASAASSASRPASRSTAPSIPTSARSRATRSRCRSTSASRCSSPRSGRSSWKAWASSTSPAPAATATCAPPCTPAASSIRFSAARSRHDRQDDVRRVERARRQARAGDRDRPNGEDLPVPNQDRSRSAAPPMRCGDRITSAASSRTPIYDGRHNIVAGGDIVAPPIVGADRSTRRSSPSQTSDRASRDQRQCDAGELQLRDAAVVTFGTQVEHLRSRLPDGHGVLQPHRLHRRAGRTPSINFYPKAGTDFWIQRIQPVHLRRRSATIDVQDGDEDYHQHRHPLQPDPPGLRQHLAQPRPRAVAGPATIDFGNDFERLRAACR